MTLMESSVLGYTDPVCGRALDLGTPFCSEHGGEMLFFCSEVCQTHFVSDPVRYLDFCALDWCPVPAPAQPSLLHTPHHPLRRLLPPEARQAQGAGAAAPGGLRGLVEDLMLEWRERRFAAQVTGELLERYRGIMRQYPYLARQERYKILIMERVPCGLEEADAILAHAESSFAEWPSSRQLQLSDVVHYLLVSEFLAGHRSELGMHTDIQQLVSARVPRQL